MINKTHILLLLLLFSGSVSLLCCKAKKKIPASAPEEQCAFYTIKLVKDTVTNKTTAEITNIKIVDKKVRYIPDEAKTHEPNFLRIEIIYPFEKIIHAATEHPLYKRIDLFSESGIIEAKSISLSQGEVFLRVPYFGKPKKISITEIVNFKESPLSLIKNEK